MQFASHTIYTPYFSLVSNYFKKIKINNKTN